MTASRRLLPIDYIGHDSNPLSEVLPCLQFQADPIVRCLLSRPSTIADPESFRRNCYGVPQGEFCIPSFEATKKTSLRNNSFTEEK